MHQQTGRRDDIEKDRWRSGAQANDWVQGEHAEPASTLKFDIWSMPCFAERHNDSASFGQD